MARTVPSLVSMPRSRNARLRLRRATLLIWTAIRYGANPLARKILRLPKSTTSNPVRLRLAFERLGLTYLKLGQYLASRFDLLPEDVCRELGKLFETVPPIPFETARAVIESELGAPLDQLFSRFDEKPIAAASVGQVHEAFTKTGDRVAVKVQRPGIERVFRADIKNAQVVTCLVDAMHLLGRLSAAEILWEFANWTLKETNFELEGATADAVAQNRAPYEIIPKIFWDLTSEKVLTLEFLDGTSMAQIDRTFDAGGFELLAEKYPDIDIDLVLRRLTSALLRQIFLLGLFHGDPHPGNILVLSDNRVAFIDFGIFGQLSPYDRELLGGQIENLAVGNIDESLRFYIRQLHPTEDSDPRAFRHEARKVLQEWYDVSLRPDAPISERHVGRYMTEMINISRKHYLLYDMSYLLYWRAINSLDATALRLSDHFDLIEELRTFFETIRPDMYQRVLDVAFDSRVWAAIGAVGRAAPGHLAGRLTDGSAGDHRGLVQYLDPPASLKGQKRSVRLLLTILVATSFLSLGVRLGGSLWLVLPVIAVGVLLSTAAAVRSTV